MKSAAASPYSSPAQMLTPIYIEAGLFATLQKKGLVAKYIALNSRPSEKSLLEHCASIATVNHSPPAPQASGEATPSAAERIINSSTHVPVCDRSALTAENLTDGWEVIPSSDYPLAACQTGGESKLPIATVPHSPPAWQESAKATPSVIHSTVSCSKRATVLDRVALDLEARFTKSNLKLKAKQAASDLLEAMAPDSKTNAADAVNRFETSMKAVVVSIDNFKASALYPEIKNEIAASIQRMTAAKFAGLGSSVTSNSIKKVREILELADQTPSRQPDPTENFTCRTIANQTLGIFQEHLYNYLEIETKRITKELMDAAEPRSKTTIAAASEIFADRMITIFKQKENFKDHALYKDFERNIVKFSTDARSAVYHLDVERDNMADWKAKTNKIAQESSAFSREDYPQQISTPQRMFAIQLRWMKEKEFTDQVQNGIKQIFKRRYEVLIFFGEQKGPDFKTFDATKKLIENVKTAVKDKCEGKNGDEIADEIQRNRDKHQKLLIAGEYSPIFTHRGPSRYDKAVNEFLNHNQGTLDLAICGMILAHLDEMRKAGYDGD